MIKDFVPSLKEDDAENNNRLWLVFRGNELLINLEKEELPVDADVQPENLEVFQPVYLGRFAGRDVTAAVVPEDFSPPDKLDFLRSFDAFKIIDDSYFSLVSYAFHLAAWDKSNSFCGTCGKPTARSVEERFKLCPHCSTTVYPRISPAVVVGVIRGDEILLARAHYFPEDFFSIVAGYVEPGESLEECLEREVFEETGIKVKKISYFGSQPWGLTGSLMIGYTAEYESGDIVIEEKEIAEARWFPLNDLPNLPPGTSLSRQIIDWLAGSRTSV